MENVKKKKKKKKVINIRKLNFRSRFVFIQYPLLFQNLTVLL